MQIGVWQGELVSDTRSSWISRLAVGWGRAESTVTKVLLFSVFVLGLVAQFVKPVGDALQDKVYLGGALLTVVGYVLYAEVQRLNAGHSAQRAAEENLQTVTRRLDEEVRRLNRVLAPRAGEVVTPSELEEQFKTVLETRGDVRLKVLGFTGETFTDPLVRILQGLTTRTVELRVLVPDFTKEIEVPGLVGMDGKACDAPHFRQDLVDQIVRYEGRLKDQIERMEYDGRGTGSVEFRVLHMSPSLKLYFIDNDVVYEGIYDKIVLRRDPGHAGLPSQSQPNGSGVRLLDLLGYDSLLTRWSSDGGEQAQKMLLRRRELFETLWSAAHGLSTGLGAPLQPDGS
ncbi:ATP/GTP-binding protein [Streptomyces sp. NPDC013161]|uniref:ATP/GTP-binding protein n=1 Tax=Streptomyces sp. NPDC013161 TaxID=3364862 RepID=UPI0036B91FA9